MKVSDSHHVKMAKQNLKKELDNLDQKHNVELEKVKNSHLNRKAQLDNSYDADINRIQNDNHKKLIVQNQRNEETLSKLQDSLEDVKGRVETEKKQIQDMNAKKIDDNKQIFEANIQSKQTIQQSQLDDLQHQGQIEIKKLARNKHKEQKDLNHEQTEKTQETLAGHQSKVSNSKQIFDKRYHAQVDKYRDALRNQDKDFDKEFVNNERSHQNKLKNTTVQFKTEAEKIQSDGEKKIKHLNETYETKFRENYERAQSNISNLSKRREKLENDLIAQMKENVQVEVDKDSDPFYKFQKIAPEVLLNKDSNSYQIKIETTADAAKEFKLSGQNRELKLQMKRDYQFSNTDKAGVSNSVNKYESYSTKIPVDEIVNGREVTKTYEDGVLTFDIKLA